ncbi:UDP-N-acetylmuramoyl-L-alanine--D-glutamate ligase [Leptothrix ochracea]|uniref:UDP-N-acetylmuramoyl-L-alanine--D-glutamate ligase n=2 Tax=Leptothrix ochracea TaxID=735331 RepID=UPI0034E29759
MQGMQGQSVLILGLGDSGLAMARWAARCGAARIVVADSRAQPPRAAQLKAEVPLAESVCGFDPALLDGMTRVFKSPGLSPLDPALAPLLAQVQVLGLPVAGELGLYAQALADLKAERAYAPKVLAITGTNGKTTTTSLTALLVERCGHSVGLAGNIGPTLLDTLSQALDNDRLPDVWVLELSSFQLDGVEGFEPTAAAVLNVTQDHLDWHGSMAAYAAAKAGIFGPGTVQILNRDEAPTWAMARSTAVGFSLGVPQRVGDWGLSEDNGMTWLVRAGAAEDEPPASSRRRRAAEPSAALVLQRLMPADALRIRGRHNAANALAALALTTAAGLPLAPMLHGLREYTGEPHRVQCVGVLDGVELYDDSKGTNVGATVAALNGLGADKAPGQLVVILGGDGKGQDFAPLLEPIRRHARAVALIGRDAGLIEAALMTANLPLKHHLSLEAATRWGFEQARSGDALLLSPACASLDMFRNYAHRAEVFVATTQALAAERGAWTA